jgi:glycosyltransferase involved in cell wall biosynthesis
VNNNSTDDTQKISEEFLVQNKDLNLRIIFEGQQGLSYARNRGIIEARGEYISYIDDDAIATPDYAKNIILAFESNKDYDALGGMVIPVYEGNEEPKWLSKHAWGMVAKVDNGQQVEPFSPKYPVGCNMVFRKSVFTIIGDFNTDLANRCDDRYIFHMMAKHKRKTLYYPAVSVNHHIPLSRISDEGVKKIATLSGSEFRRLLQHEPKYRIFLKICDYLFKIGASLILGIGFILKGEPSKTKLTNIMYYSLKGFLTANKLNN